MQASNPVWLVVLGKRPYDVVHSIHSEEATARAFRDCKEHDGEDCRIVVTQACEVDDLVATVEAAKG